MVALSLPVVASDHDGTRARLFALLDEIHLGETLPFVRCFELLGEVIVTYTTSIDDGIWGQHVLKEKEREISLKGA